MTETRPSDPASTDLLPEGWLGVVAAVAVAAVLAGAAALILLSQTEPVYRSDATLLIDQPEAIAAADSPGLIDKLDRLRSKYVGLVRTRTIAEPVADQTTYELPVVANSLTSALLPTSLLFTVGATNPSPEAAETLAEATVDAVITYVQQEQAAAGVPPQRRVEVSVATPAGDAVRTDEPLRRYAAAGGLGVLALLALGAAWYVRPRRR